MQTAIALPVKEVERTNKEVLVLQETAAVLRIAHPDDMAHAADLLENIKQAENTITTRKEEITRPLMRSLASVRDLFKPIELSLENAKKIVKAKVLAFQTAEEARIEEEQARIEKRVEKGTMRVDTAAAKLEQLGEAPKSAHGNTGKLTTRIITKVRVVDETLVPREYLVVDMPKVTEAVLKRGAVIPGVEKYQEKIIAS